MSIAQGPHQVVPHPRLFILVLKRRARVEFLRWHRLPEHRIRRHRLLGIWRGLQDASGRRHAECAVRPLPHHVLQVVGHQARRAQMVSVYRVELAAPEDADQHDAAIVGGQIDVLGAALAHRTAVVVLGQQRVARNLVVSSIDEGGADAGVGRSPHEQPAELLFQPGDEVGAQFRLAGQGLVCQWLAFEDALAQGVVQVADAGGLTVLEDLDFGQALWVMLVICERS